MTNEKVIIDKMVKLHQSMAIIVNDRFNKLASNIDKRLSVMEVKIDTNKRLISQMTAEEVIDIIRDINPEERWKVVNEIKKFPDKD